MKARTRKSARLLKGSARTLSAQRRVAGIPTLKRLPEPPEGLSELAKREWTRCGQLAVELGSLTPYDVPLLEVLVRTLASIVELEALLRRDGLVLESGSGARKAHPALAAVDRARAIAHRILTDLGLSPPGREKLSLEPQSGPNRFSGL